MFAPKKLAWQFRTGEYEVTKSGKHQDEISAKYGSKLESDDVPK